MRHSHTTYVGRRSDCWALCVLSQSRCTDARNGLPHRCVCAPTRLSPANVNGRCPCACPVCAHRELRRVGVVIPFPWAPATTTAKTGRGFVPPVLLLSVRVDKGRGADQGRTCTDVWCVVLGFGFGFAAWLHLIRTGCIAVCVRAHTRTCEGLHGHHVHKTRQEQGSTEYR
jgi:hypothetical protein